MRARLHSPLRIVSTFARRPGPVLRNISGRFLPYWIAAVGTALIGVLFSRVFALSERFALGWAASNPYYSLIVIPAGLVASWALVALVSPEASGSGIPQLIASLKALPDDYGLASRLLSPLVVVVKILSACICMASGGVIGREGPMLQISGGVFHFVFRRWPRVRSVLDLRSMILAGGAAGLAAAFNTPLGGIVFAIEELAKVHLSQIRTYILHAVIIAGLMAEGILGNYLYLDQIRAADAGVPSLVKVAFAGSLIGACGAVFGILLWKIVNLRLRFSLGWQGVLAAVFGLCVAVMFLGFGERGLGSGREVIIQLLRHPEQPQSLLLPVVRTFANLFSYGAGVAGGIFAPSLASGASFGSWLSGYLPGVDPQLLVLVGMVAFLTGVTQTPITSCVLVLEMTDGHRVIFSLMLAALFAQGTAKLIQPESFYELVSERWLEAEHAVAAVRSEPESQ